MRQKKQTNRRGNSRRLGYTKTEQRGLRLATGIFGRGVVGLAEARFTPRYVSKGLRVLGGGYKKSALPPEILEQQLFVKPHIRIVKRAPNGKALKAGEVMILRGQKVIKIMPENKVKSWEAARRREKFTESLALKLNIDYREAKRILKETSDLGAADFRRSKARFKTLINRLENKKHKSKDDLGKLRSYKRSYKWYKVQTGRRLAEMALRKLVDIYEQGSD